MSCRYTASEFDNAVTSILGSDIVNAIGKGNRTQLQNMAIVKIFLDSMEKQPAYKNSIDIIRYCSLYLREHGEFGFVRQN